MSFLSPSEVMLAGPVKFGIDPLAWEILPRIDIGPLAVSPHGIGVAAGFLLGAKVLVARARKRGGPDENDIWNGLFWALIGAMVGARLGYVLGHWSEVTDNGNDLLGVFKVWEGGISLLGGITGGILAALPYMRRKRIPFWPTMDLVAPALALGIFIGRIGDLVIGDHLGKPTDFALGWRCLGESGEEPIAAAIYRRAVRQGEPPSLGCFDVVVHQTALYDFLAAGVIFGLLVWLGRKTRNAGMLACVFGLTYGAVRFGTDFLRVDERYFGLTGSQITAAVVGLICLAFLVLFRGAPPRWRTRTFAEVGGEASADEADEHAVDEGATLERDEPDDEVADDAEADDRARGEAVAPHEDEAVAPHGDEAGEESYDDTSEDHGGPFADAVPAPSGLAVDDEPSPGDAPLEEPPVADDAAPPPIGEEEPPSATTKRGRWRRNRPS